MAGREPSEGPDSIAAVLARSPVATLSLLAFVVGGAVAAGFLFEELTPARRVLGGALLGFVSWLILHFRRLFE